METHPPDIVLTDYNMPEMNGIEFLKKAKEYNSFMKMIILTGGSDVNATIEAIRLGVFDYILKPCPPERITLVLKNAQKMYSMERLNKELLKKLQSLASF
jgi:two-component system response regulator YesN